MTHQLWATGLSFAMFRVEKGVPVDQFILWFPLQKLNFKWVRCPLTSLQRVWPTPNEILKFGVIVIDSYFGNVVLSLYLPNLFTFRVKHSYKLSFSKHQVKITPMVW